MERVRQPNTPTKLIPVMGVADTAKLLAACRGKGFSNLLDEALIRLYASTGARPVRHGLEPAAGGVRAGDA